MAEDVVSMVMTGVNEVQAKLGSVNERVLGIRAYLNTTVYRQIQNAQMQRWMTEDGSEGGTWKPLSVKYARYKKIKYGGGPKHKWIGGRGADRPWVVEGAWPTYPGAGTKMLIATGRLVSNVIGPMDTGSVFGLTGDPTDHRKIVTDNSIFVGTTVPYADEVNKERNFTTLSQNTLDSIYAGLAQYVMNGTSVA